MSKKQNNAKYLLSFKMHDLRFQCCVLYYKLGDKEYIFPEGIKQISMGAVIRIIPPPSHSSSLVDVAIGLFSGKKCHSWQGDANTFLSLAKIMKNFNTLFIIKLSVWPRTGKKYFRTKYPPKRYISTRVKYTWISVLKNWSLEYPIR